MRSSLISLCPIPSILRVWNSFQGWLGFLTYFLLKCYVKNRLIFVPCIKHTHFLYLWPLWQRSLYLTSRRQFNIQLNLLQSLVFMSLQKSVDSFFMLWSEVIAQTANGWKFLGLALSQAVLSANGKKGAGEGGRAGGWQRPRQWEKGQDRRNTT